MLICDTHLGTAHFLLSPYSLPSYPPPLSFQANPSLLPSMCSHHSWADESQHLVAVVAVVRYMDGW